MNLFELIRSGLVRRWHANPDLAHTGETNGHHQWAVATLVLALHPAPRLELVREALWHDVGERKAGDLPRPFKHDNPEIAAAHADFERRARAEMCMVADLDHAEELWLKLCDRFAAFLWMLSFAPHLRHHDWWEGEMTWIIAEAGNLGSSASVSAMINTHLDRLRIGS